MIDFGDHDSVLKVTLVKLDQMLVCPLSLEFRPNLVDCIMGLRKKKKNLIKF